MTRAYWLSFCDGDKPTGQQFLGVCLVDVTDDMAADALLDIALRFPMAMDGAEWVAAAIKEAHRLGCNPGGEVASNDVTDGPPDILAAHPRGKLMSLAELEAIAPTITQAELEAES